MKTNMINSNSIMKQYMNYICALILLVGISANAWGVKSYTLITDISSLSTNDYVVLLDVNDESNLASANGVTGWNSSKDATISTSSWMEYKVTKSSTTFTLYDETAKKYIAQPTDNHFKYDATAGDCTVDEDGWLICNSRYLAINGSNYRFYSTSSSYAAFYVWKVQELTPHTITFNAGSGSCNTSTSGSVTSYTLPTASPSSHCADEGWVFAGWKESSAQTETTTFPVLYAAGTTYSPAADITLYAVYYQPSTTYKKITNANLLLKGCNYIWAMFYDSEVSGAGDDKYWALKNVADGSGYITSQEVVPSTDVISSPSEDVIWELKGTSGAWQLYNSDESLYVRVSTSPYLNASSENLKITESSGKFKLKNGSKNLIFYNDYTHGGSTANEWNEYYVYRQEGTFASSPNCCTTDRTLSFEKSSTTIYWPDGTTFTNTASPSAGTGMVSYSITDADPANCATVNSTTGVVTFTAFGTVEVTASIPRSGVYCAAEESYILEMACKPRTVSFTTEDVTKKTYVGTYTQTASASAGSGAIIYSIETNDGFTINNSTGEVTFSNAGEAIITATIAANGGYCSETGNYMLTVIDPIYTDYKFSCAELTLTPHLVTASTPIFITSTAEKTVRSQDYIEISGNGLTPSTELTFPGLPSKFAIKNADGTAISTDGSGEVSANAYIFYNPGVTTEDGLDELTGITVSISGTKPKTVSLTQSIIGRHLPADFVIAGKVGNKWYALPADFSDESTPNPVEIAVNDINNPSIAYTASTNIYNLYGQNSGASGFLYNDGDSDGNPDGDKIKLGMKNNSNKPLFAFASPKNSLKGDGTATVTNNINKQYWWTLKQTNTTINISNAQDAKYILTSSNNSGTLSIKNSPFVWGTYASGVEELRLIPASEGGVVFAEASVVAWGKNGAIIESKKPYEVSGNSYIVGKLPGGIKSDTIELRETRTSKGSGTGTRYNYTVDFGSDFDFSASEGQMLTLEWFNSSKVLKAVSNVTVPRIVASNTTINSANYTSKSVWNTEVHVLPGDTLTIDASGYSPNKDVTIKELNIYPGAAVIINKDTLKVTDLVLRSGWSRIGEKRYAVGNLYINPGSGNGSLKATNAYMDWYIDYDQYYPIAVPWKVATNSISYKNMVVDIDQGLIVRYYDGERHAKGGDGDTNWKQYSWATNMPTHLVPGKGYAITARRPAGKAFSIIRMPLTIPSADWTKNGEQGEVSETHKDQVEVIAWVKEEGETPKHAKGWNFIANPYMCNYKGDITHEDGDEYDIAYVNIPDVNFKEFDQVEIGKATLKPGSGFLIQTEKTGTLTFGTSNRKASAPSFLAEVPKVSKQKAYITLSGDDAEDEMGLIISERYTAEYEINADLEKLLSDGNTLRTYMIYNNINMAYVAINEELAKEWIPVTVRIPATGEYTFSLHEASKVSELEGIYLIDYTNNIITNLIENNYSFMATEGTIAGRFAINAIVGKHDTPTDIDIIHAGGDIKSNQPFKFIYNDKVFILHNGVIYDSTGKKVREIKK